MPLNVLVLTSAPMGIELAARLARLDEVRLLTVVTTRTVPRQHGRLEKLRRLLRDDGPPGILRELSGAARRLFGPTGGGSGSHGGRPLSRRPTSPP